MLERPPTGSKREALRGELDSRWRRVLGRNAMVGELRSGERNDFMPPGGLKREGVRSARCRVAPMFAATVPDHDLLMAARQMRFGRDIGLQVCMLLTMARLGLP